MITITARQRVVAGKEVELEAVMKSLVEQVKKNEPKCTIFEFLRAQEQPGIYMVIEQYFDQAALDQHLAQPYLQDRLPKIFACLQCEPELTTYTDT
ncbi:MAG: hypothetical protein F6K19_19860 [Cyanothece sp. SIO1E1]|nr:hypothetical protein [Cyanothece sp. SIO1E1]